MSVIIFQMNRKEEVLADIVKKLVDEYVFDSCTDLEDDLLLEEEEEDV